MTHVGRERVKGVSNKSLTEQTQSLVLALAFALMSHIDVKIGLSA